MEQFQISYTDLAWLKEHVALWGDSLRGIERESLRITSTGHLSPNRHPTLLGAPLTHPWWTTDYAENLLELRTDTCTHIPQMWAMLKGLHGYLWYGLKGTLLWPYSMPPELPDISSATLADYGQSPLGQFKHAYRKGLRARYGNIMQLIGGVHYNFSFSQTWLASLAQHRKLKVGRAGENSALYLHLIRNYYRVGWILPYLVGATPVLPASLQNHGSAATSRDRCYMKGGYYGWPYATSLRLTSKGYYSPYQKLFSVQYNHLKAYLRHLRRGTTTPLAAVWKWPTPVPRSPINDSILQLEDEFYGLIRPKGGLPLPKEWVPSQTLERTGICYVEVRALDLNPFEPFGLSLETAYFIELLLLWCLLAPSPNMTRACMKRAQHNWQLVARYGRMSKQPLRLMIPSFEQAGAFAPLYLHTAAEALVQAMTPLAVILDTHLGSCYTTNLHKVHALLANSIAQDLEQCFNKKDDRDGLERMLLLATRHDAQFRLHYRALSAAEQRTFEASVKASHAKQKQLEADARDGTGFESYLTQWKITTQQLRPRFFNP